MRIEVVLYVYDSFLLYEVGIGASYRNTGHSQIVLLGMFFQMLLSYSYIMMQRYKKKMIFHNFVKKKHAPRIVSGGLLVIDPYRMSDGMMVSSSRDSARLQLRYWSRLLSAESGRGSTW